MSLLTPEEGGARGDGQSKVNSLQLAQSREQPRSHTVLVLQSYTETLSCGLIPLGEEEPLLLAAHVVQQAHSVRMVYFKAFV